MSGELAKRYTVGKHAETELHAMEEAEDLDDLQAFGLLRGIRDQAIMLELRHKDGNIDAFPYAWLSKANFDPSEGITLRFGAETVKITGRNLNAEVRPNVRLFAAIVRHRVPYIQEADGPTLLSSHRQAIVVERITVKT
jgi:hypothetical protein